jgi:hypothetical protein
MEIVKEKMAMGNIHEYPQLKRLPNGTRFVKQDRGSNREIDKYASFLASGKIILISSGNSIKEARKLTLQELNSQLRDVALIYGSVATKEMFAEVLK